MHKFRLLMVLMALSLVGFQPTSAAETRCPYYYTAVQPPAWAPTADEWARATEIANELSISELAGASLVGNYAGSLNSPSTENKNQNLVALGNQNPALGIRRLGLGGVVLFSENATSGKTAFAEKTKLGSQFPYFFVAVDQEGGTVVRLRDDIEPPIPAAVLGRMNDSAITETAAKLSGDQLRAAGINVVFAPVADLKTSQTEPSLVDRTFGSKAGAVGNQVAATVKGYAGAGVMPTLKHFPGLGGITADTHFAAGRYNGSFTKLCEQHLAPFAAGISAGAPIVMLGHAVYPMFGTAPASANSKIINELLRQDLSFNGIVITDSMAMAAASTGLKPNQNVWVRALRAGTDLLLMPSNAVRAKQAIEKALTNGKLSVVDRRAAIARVLAWRMANQRVVDSLPVYAAGAKGLKQAAIDFRTNLN